MKIDTTLVENELSKSIALAVYNYTKTKNINDSVSVFIMALVIICGFSLTVKYLKTNKRRKILLASGIDIADKMSGEEFELFLLAHYKNLGYKGRTTPKTNDYGADLVLTKDGKVIVVQAKRWNYKVGIEAVQQIIDAKTYYNADKCIVTTTNYFTPNAVNLASSANVSLCDRTKLLDIMSRFNGR
ncbi:restriction endonuclease [Clostridium estertheticum]|uniref:restriction endonuclease n=1 Tax=Clostridium estertheticum TaxID=238834 RepID=UPI001C0D635B|nr:restriction endonuclease [Clostridium estertheticum]MBU3173372.1 restriction endonuclease [Clostridium estertheticum]